MIWWIVVAFLTGLVLGWVAKTMVLVNQLHIYKQGQVWLVYLGGRIIDRVGTLQMAIRRQAQFQALLRGRLYKEE